MNYPLHAVLNTEQLQGPDYRVTVHNSTREGRVILSRWPVTSIVSVQVAPAGVYPLQWTTVPSGFWRIEYPVIGRYGSNTAGGSGEGGQAILIAPGYVSWCAGRWGVVVSVQYFHGWPHASLSAPAVSGATTLQVDDVTGWAPFTAGQPGATGILYDPAHGQEPVMVTGATATNSSNPPVGPGTLTLSSALSYAHPSAGVMVSSLPSDVIWASVLFAAAEALTRGAQATVVQATPGSRGGGTGAVELKKRACQILARFRRTI
jgi:hypothetical protein